MSKVDVEKFIASRLEEIACVEDSIEYTERLTQFLSMMHPSDAHVIIRDQIVPAKNKKIQNCKRDDVAKYQAFQNIVMECKASFDHDRAHATNLDVDKAVSKSYGITMRVIRANMDMEQARFDKLTSAINRIEEHLGLDVTDFREGDNNDSTEHEDAQNVERVITEAGEPCEAE